MRPPSAGSLWLLADLLAGLLLICLIAFWAACAEQEPRDNAAEAEKPTVFDREEYVTVVYEPTGDSYREYADGRKEWIRKVSD